MDVSKWKQVIVDTDNQSFAYHLEAAKCDVFLRDDFFSDVRLTHFMLKLPLKPAMVNGRILRHSCWMVGEGCQCVYTYGYAQHQRWRPTDYTPEIRQLQNKLCAIAGLPNNLFNSMFGQYYEDGKQKLDWHADDEPLFEPGCQATGVPILSFSFGADRCMGVRKTAGGTFEKIVLCSKDLFFMDGLMQRFYEHCIYPARTTGGRYNLTFRCIVNCRCNKDLLLFTEADEI